jgi:hypothetical protein
VATPLAEQISLVNTRMMELLDGARKALRGEAQFGVEEIHKIREPLNELAPILRRSAELRASQPDLVPQLDLYNSLLSQLQTTLDQLRVMLLARQAKVLAGRAQLDAATHWLAAFQAAR